MQAQKQAAQDEAAEAERVKQKARAQERMQQERQAAERMQKRSADGAERKRKKAEQAEKEQAERAQKEADERAAYAQWWEEEGRAQHEAQQRHQQQAALAQARLELPEAIKQLHLAQDALQHARDATRVSLGLGLPHAQAGRELSKAYSKALAQADAAQKHLLVVKSAIDQSGGNATLEAQQATHNYQSGAQGAPWLTLYVCPQSRSARCVQA